MGRGGGAGDGGLLVLAASVDELSTR